MAKSAVKPKANFKDSQDDYQLLLRELADKHYKSVYLLMGDEPYFIDKISSYIEKNVLSPEEQTFNLSVVYGAETTVTDLVHLASSYPMLQTYSVVVVKDFGSLKKSEELLPYLKLPLSSTILVLCHKGGAMDRRSQLYKRINEIGRVYESVEPREYELGGWLSTLFTQKGYKLTNEASAIMIDSLGVSLSKIEHEAEKLLTRLDPSHKTITPADIEENIGISKDFNNFELTKALSTKNGARALLIAKHFAASPKDNPYVVTIQMLFTHFVRIFSLGIVIWNSKTKRTPMPSDMELMKLLKVGNLFFIREYKEAVVHYPSAKSFQALGAIREYDLKSKGLGGSATATDGDLLRELIIRILSL